MDDGRLGDEMTLEGIAQQLAEFRVEMRSAFGALDTKVGVLDTKVGVLDTKVGVLDTKVGVLDTKVGALDTKVSGLVGQVHSLDGMLGMLSGKVDSLDAKMTIGFEETKGLISFGFESVQMLDEKIGRRFDDTDRAHADQQTVLQAAIGHLSREVAPPEGPTLRRRR